MKTILLINGPNLNLIGSREPEIYGSTELDDLIEAARSTVKDTSAGKVELTPFQSNHEGEIVDRIQAAKAEYQEDFIVINAGALTHTSIAIRDALLSVAIPFIEVHLSNIFAREEFRRVSYLSDIAKGIICGFGPQSYQLALSQAVNELLDV